MSRQLLVLALVLVLASCARMAQSVVAQGKAARMLPRFADCPDRQPVRLLLGQTCPGGVCGYSCEPARWLVTCPPEGGTE
jgi:hypothetical protein